MASINLSSSAALRCSQTCIHHDMWTRLHGTKPSLAEGLTSKLAVVSLGSKSSGKVKDRLRTRAAVVSGEGDLLSYSTSSDIFSGNALDNDRPLGIEMQPDAVSMRALATDTAPTSVEFAIDDDEFDLDKPTEGFASIPEAIEDIRQGKIVIVVDDEDRENEGDMVMAAELATPEAMAFFVKHGTGIVCVSMKEEDLERLQLPLMVASKDNEEKLSTAFTVTVVRDLDTVTVLNEFLSYKDTRCCCIRPSPMATWLISLIFLIHLNSIFIDPGVPNF